jgi:hypothetical protein
VGVRKLFLKSFHQRLVRAGEELEDTVAGWSVLGGVGDVDDGLGAEVLGASTLESLCGGATLTARTMTSPKEAASAKVPVRAVELDFFQSSSWPGWRVPSVT